jgi:type III restriction enzyme
MNRHVASISGRLSLRAPQRQSLEILADAWDRMAPAKDRDVAAALAALREQFPEVEDFEREFPSLCFALATGVGKTRLMGAFITYLHVAFGVRHFFVLAPNLTIYDKLIRDFQPNTPKYVFQGIAEFAVNPPEVVTGETYDTRARHDAVRAGGDLFGTAVEINVFNISKINSEVRGGKEPRIKRLRETLGESYFDYLAELPDLVLLMDESHRYRAAAGVRAINDLRPIIGLELTATPVVEAAGKSVRFKNVAFDYPLGKALADGFVKTPCVVTRTNFRADQHNEADLERIKLEDGIRLHEETKVELQAYAANSGRPPVKPFVLVIAKDTDHAARLKAQIESPSFFHGQYAGKVIEIHSGKSGEEAEENVQRLLDVEKPDEPTEIVVHVNMLKEGWDVTNLYTIVPLRTANARVLIEQSIGRGLRLPYGERTGVPSVDRLSIVAHDRFQEIVDEANRPDSIVRMETRHFDPDGADAPQQVVAVAPVFEIEFLKRAAAATAAAGAADGSTDSQARAAAANAVLRTTMDVVAAQRGVATSAALQSPEVQKRIVAEVAARLGPVQQTLPGMGSAPVLADQVSKVLSTYSERTIDIPRIIVVPKGEVRTGFRDFDLDASYVRLQQQDQRLMLQNLGSSDPPVFIEPATGAGDEERLENYLVRELMDKDDVDYDRHSDLLYKLSGQMVAHLRTYQPDDDAVRNVLRQSQRALGAIIHAQMQSHAWEESAGYDAIVSQGFTPLRIEHFKASEGTEVRNFRVPVEDGVEIRRMLFGGFSRCLYPIQKFDVRPEWRFANILESDSAPNGVQKWVKPGRTAFQIRYTNDASYEPDFVVETGDAKFLCEPKRADEMEDAEVLAKANAAVEWCAAATKHELANGGKPWHYLLIPHDEIRANMTLAGLAARFERGAA